MNRSFSDNQPAERYELVQAGPIRLYTYKVRVDKGSAPNPYYGACTLAICKPKIRRYAKPGDIIVGFGCKTAGDPEEEFRVVYVMQAERVIPWGDYIEACRTKMRGKIPSLTSPNRWAGDCIYVLDGDRIARRPLASLSEHDETNFAKDVEHGINVIVARTYWYLGRGDQFRLVVPDKLRQIVPRSQGHRSLSNQPFLTSFVRWFNGELAARGIPVGMDGMPKDSHVVQKLTGRAACAVPADRSRSPENRMRSDRTDC